MLQDDLSLCLELELLTFCPVVVLLLHLSFL